MKDHVFSFDVGKFRIDAKLAPDGEAVQIYCGDGRLVVIPSSSNMFTVRPEHFWDRPTRIKIAAHIIKTGRNHRMHAQSLAERIVDSLAGMNKP